MESSCETSKALAAGWAAKGSGWAAKGSAGAAAKGPEAPPPNGSAAGGESGHRVRVEERARARARARARVRGRE